MLIFNSDLDYLSKPVDTMTHQWDVVTGVSWIYVIGNMTMDICVFEKAKLIKFNNRLCLMMCAVLVKQDNKSI